MKSWNKTILQTLGRHPVHPFPARMAPGIALDALADGTSPLRVLDPMMGSGTVLAVARSCGHRAYGCDLDPLAVLMAEVWTTTIDQQEIADSAQRTLARAKRLFSSTKTGAAYPEHSDEETRRFLRYWFDDYARRQLAALATTIAQIRRRDVRNLLWVVFSRLIIAKQAGASRAMDLSHSRPHRVFDRAPMKPFRSFSNAVNRVVKNCPQRSPGVKVGPRTHVQIGDARALKYEAGSFDLVVTSPPYLNAIDYVRCSKFSLVWMGHSLENLRELRSTSIGSEASSVSANDNVRVQRMLKELNLAPMPPTSIMNRLRRYIHDIDSLMKQIARVLRQGGRAVIVIGDSTMRGTFVRNSAIVTMAAEHAGLRAIDHNVRTLPPNRRYLPPPTSCGSSASLGGRMRQEVVVSFRKV
jgi:DNA modification methylase